MGVTIPAFLKEHAILALLGVIGFLFAFYVENTFVTREALAGEQSALMLQLQQISQQITEQAKQDKQNLVIDGLQDAIADCNDEIVELGIYLREAPENILNNARQARIDQLAAQKERLQAELSQEMLNVHQ